LFLVSLSIPSLTSLNWFWHFARCFSQLFKLILAPLSVCLHPSPLIFRILNVISRICFSCSHTSATCPSHIFHLLLLFTSLHYISLLYLSVISLSYISQLHLSVTSLSYISQLHLSVTSLSYISQLHLSVTSLISLISLIFFTHVFYLHLPRLYLPPARL
jgi:hypothetical protein